MTEASLQSLDLTDMSMDEQDDSRRAGFDGKKWEVHKFGGTSVANADCYLNVAIIVEEQLGIQKNSKSNGNCDLNLSVVVSAMGGKPKTTDLLLSTISAAADRDNALVDATVQKIMEKHCVCVEALFPNDAKESKRLLDMVALDINDIRDILKTVSLMKWQAARISELVSGYGEIWSAQILSALLKARCTARTKTLKKLSDSSLQDIDVKHHAFCYLDARRVIIIDEEAIQDGSVRWGICQDKLQKVYAEERAQLDELYGTDCLLHFCMTGYVCSNTDGVASTLGRDGSDHSAAIMGKILHSNTISIWTDVNGVLSADPRKVPTAFAIPEVSYAEAMELAYFGAKVIHPKTMEPAMSVTPNIPIYIRNTFNSAFKGTRIYTKSTTHDDADHCVCGFSSVENIALINVEGSGMMGVRGVAKRLFSTLEQKNVNVVLISQASSEHSITFATIEKQAAMAKAAIEEEFHKEIRENHISNLDIKAPCSIIAAVGDGMMGTSGVSGRFFSALGDANINVHAISQGCSQRNISAVVYTEESTRALRAVHAAFRLSHTVVRVGLIGTNMIGNSLLKLLEAQRNKLRKAFDIDVQVCAIMADGSSNDIVTLENGERGGKYDSITLSAFDMAMGDYMPSVAFDDEFVATKASGGLGSLLKCLLNNESAHHVVFDCTAEETVGNEHAGWLEAGVNVVTANNTGISGPKELRQAISAAETVHGKLSAKYLPGVTVGGALPILSTIQGLLSSGDMIRRVDGIFSVSLSYIMFRVSPPPHFARCSEFDDDSSFLDQVGVPCLFSEAVKEAIALGLMEEHPEKDLNNEYTARVLMVLAKEMGLDHVHDTFLIQKASDKIVEDAGGDYLSFTSDLDQKIKERVESASERGCVLRHISSVDVKSKSVEIKITEVPNNHVFAVTSPSCGCVRFFTRRHRRYPLIVQGPAAGADSTSSALLAELLSLMRSKVGPRSRALTRTGSSAFLA